MKKISIFALILCLISPTLVFACTDFQIKAKDKSVVVGRSMEFPIDTKSLVMIVPRGQKFSIVNSKKVTGISWTAKYGYIGVNAFNAPDTYVEGLNEKGLAFEGLMYTGAEYQPVVPGKYLPLDKFGAWLMGNFATVDEVKKALAGVNISASEMDRLKDMGLHVAIHDAKGQSLVVEFVGGKANVYDNPVGVMTNRPDFPWQLTNLRNYINLDSADKNPKKINGLEIEPTGVGSGMLGMPGDWTPPSRFVRTALCVNAALTPKDSAEAINLAEHILNVVDIPKGVIKESSPVPDVHLYGNAEWVLIKDLTNTALYYKTYDNTAWKKVDLKKFNLAAGNPIKSIAINSQQVFAQDVSGKLK
ncbi:MAG: choloylglycine hydrolase family protein [Candidatus Saganbacteria bacterium]|nr:choloylglycine hydrolase family protein [Candidatus Saganbacteria bacterium]